jgi:hypothetical protein
VNTIELEAQTAAELRDREKLTTREIAKRLHIAQSTVVRRLQLHDTGALPVMRTRVRKNLAPIALLAFAILVLVAAASAFVFTRSARAVTVVPASVCVRSAAKGNVTGLKATQAGACQPGWSLLVLTPQR